MRQLSSCNFTYINLTDFLIYETAVKELCHVMLLQNTCITLLLLLKGGGGKRWWYKKNRAWSRFYLRILAVGIGKSRSFPVHYPMGTLETISTADQSAQNVPGVCHASYACT